MDLKNHDFFQTVRLLTATKSAHKIFFRAAPSLGFPAHEVNEINLSQHHIEVQTSVMGLFGPNGMLPDHYTELILERLQAKDTTLRDFLDIFNHRLIALFYQAWAKYRYYVEPAKFTQLLSCLIGNGTPYLQQRLLNVPDENILFYAGLFAQKIRSPSNLSAILTDYFAVPITIISFQGKWLSLTPENHSRLSSSKNNYHQLGCSTILGRRIWDIQNNFRVRIGPLSYKNFKHFLPSASSLHALTELVRRYIGIELNFDIQLVLSANDVPLCQLSKFSLGWNTWLKTKPFMKDADETILRSKL